MNENLAVGLTTMLIGMGTVLLFLCTMIVCMLVMSRAITWLGKFFPEAVPAAVSKAVATSDDEAIAVAILAALRRK